MKTKKTFKPVTKNSFIKFAIGIYIFSTTGFLIYIIGSSYLEYIYNQAYISGRESFIQSIYAQLTKDPCYTIEIANSDKSFRLVNPVCDSKD